MAKLRARPTVAASRSPEGWAGTSPVCCQEATATATEAVRPASRSERLGGQAGSGPDTADWTGTDIPTPERSTVVPRGRWRIDPDYTRSRTTTRTARWISEIGGGADRNSRNHRGCTRRRSDWSGGDPHRTTRRPARRFRSFISQDQIEVSGATETSCRSRFRTVSLLPTGIDYCELARADLHNTCRR